MQAIEGYHLVRRIGAGGMGTVHEALDADGRRVAVKVLHEAIAADPAARLRLRREVELLHRVRGQGVARVLDAEVDGVTAFVVTELVDGPTLEDDVRENGPLEGEDLAELARGLAGGLRAIHAAGVTHRDLKPGNVMLSADGPVIIDFGIAQVADDVRLTQTGMVTGTPGYLDPEVIAGADPGPEGDWWAWAAVLTFAATGRPPFGRGTIQAVLGRVSTGLVDTAGLPGELAAVLAAALDPDPHRRLQPVDVLAALDGDDAGPALRKLLAPEQAHPPTSVLPPEAHTRVLAPAPPAPGQEAWPTTPLAPGPPSAQEAWPTAPLAPGTASAQGAGPTAPMGALPPGAREPWPTAQLEPVPGPPGGHGPVPQPWGWGPPPEVPAWARAPRRRTGTVAALGLGVSALAVVVPGAWVLGVVAAVVVLGAAGRGNQRLRTVRLRRGPRRSDAARAWLGAPVHLLWGAAAALPGLLLAGVLGGGGWWLMDTLAPGVDEVAPWLLWGAAALALAVAWTVPPTAAAREGTRAVLGGLPRPVRAGLAALALVTAVAVALFLLTDSPPDPVWSPLPDLS